MAPNNRRHFVVAAAASMSSSSSSSGAQVEGLGRSDEGSARKTAKRFGSGGSCPTRQPLRLSSSPPPRHSSPSSPPPLRFLAPSSRRPPAVHQRTYSPWRLHLLFLFFLPLSQQSDPAAPRGRPLQPPAQEEELQREFAAELAARLQQLPLSGEVVDEPPIDYRDSTAGFESWDRVNYNIFNSALHGNMRTSDAAGHIVQQDTALVKKSKKASKQPPNGDEQTEPRMPSKARRNGLSCLCCCRKRGAAEDKTDQNARLPTATLDGLNCVLIMTGGVTLLVIMFLLATARVVSWQHNRMTSIRPVVGKV